MKNNLLTSAFAGLLCVSTLASCGLLFWYNMSFKRLQNLEILAAERNQVMNLMQSILKDSVEYNNTVKNPDMARILQNVMAPPQAQPAPAKSTPVKPAARK